MVNPRGKVLPEVIGEKILFRRVWSRGAAAPQTPCHYDRGGMASSSRTPTLSSRDQSRAGVRGQKSPGEREGRGSARTINRWRRISPKPIFQNRMCVLSSACMKVRVRSGMTSERVLVDPVLLRVDGRVPRTVEEVEGVDLHGGHLLDGVAPPSQFSFFPVPHLGPVVVFLGGDGPVHARVRDYIFCGQD